MNTFRIALANLRFPANSEESIALAEQAIAEASVERAGIICFPECFVPGYRAMGKQIPPPDPAFLERAWSMVAAAAANANIAVVLGTERVVADLPLATALVINQDGTIAGFQDKVQIDPSEEGGFTAAPLLGDASLLVSPFVTRVGVIRKQSVGPRGMVLTSYSTLTSTKPSPVVMCPRFLPTRRTHSTRRQSCAAPPRTPAITLP